MFYLILPVIIIGTQLRKRQGLVALGLVGGRFTYAGALFSLGIVLCDLPVEIRNIEVTKQLFQTMGGLR